MKKQWVGWSLVLVMLLSGCQHSASTSSTSGNTSASDSKLVRTSSITLDQSSLSMVIGDKVTLTATILPANASDKVISWSSLDETVATVDNGKVSALAKGTCVLLAASGSQVATCYVTVTEKATSILPLERTGTMKSDISLSAKVGTETKTFATNIYCPAKVDYLSKDSLIQLGTGTDLTIKADLTDGLATPAGTDASGNATAAVTSAEQTQKNLKAVRDLSNLPSFFTLFDAFIPDSDSLKAEIPGAYKAFGAGMDGVYNKVSGKTGDDLANTISTMPKEILNFYQKGMTSSAGEYSASTASQARYYTYQDASKSDVATQLATVLSALASLDYSDPSKLQKTDFIAVMNSLVADGTLLTDKQNEEIKYAGQALGILLVLFAGGFNIDKTTTTDTSGRESLHFSIYLTEEGKNRAKNALLSALGYSSASTYTAAMGTLLDELKINSLSTDFTLYKDPLTSYTHFQDFDFLFSFDTGSGSESHISYQFALADARTTLGTGFFDQEDALQAKFKAARVGFDAFYPRISANVPYYDGDAPSSGVAIDQASGTAIQKAATDYSSLDTDIQFMLTEKVTPTTILNQYNQGRTELTNGITASKKNTTLSMSNIKTSFASAAGYKNFGLALSETDASEYQRVVSAEQSYLTSLATKVSTSLSALAALTVTSSEDTIKAAIDTAYKIVSQDYVSLMPSTLVGIVIKPTYPASLFVNDALVSQRELLTTNSETNDTDVTLYNLENSLTDAFEILYKKTVASGTDEATFTQVMDDSYTATPLLVTTYLTKGIAGYDSNGLNLTYNQSKLHSDLVTDTASLAQYTSLSVSVIRDKRTAGYLAYGELNTVANNTGATLLEKAAAKAKWTLEAATLQTFYQQYQGAEANLFGKSINEVDSFVSLIADGNALSSSF
jgi:hypothetical protein